MDGCHRGSVGHLCFALSCCPFRRPVLCLQPLPLASAGPGEPLGLQNPPGHRTLPSAGGQDFTNSHALDSRVVLARRDKLLSAASGCERGRHRPSPWQLRCEGQLCVWRGLRSPPGHAPSTGTPTPSVSAGAGSRQRGNLTGQLAAGRRPGRVPFLLLLLPGTDPLGLLSLLL